MKPAIGERLSRERFLELFPYNMLYIEGDGAILVRKFIDAFGERMRSRTSEGWVVINPDAKWDYDYFFSFRTMEDATMAKLMFENAVMREWHEI